MVSFWIPVLFFVLLFGPILDAISMTLVLRFENATKKIGLIKMVKKTEQKCIKFGAKNGATLEARFTVVS